MAAIQEIYTLRAWPKSKELPSTLQMPAKLIINCAINSPAFETDVSALLCHTRGILS